jgi:hypothetical protein
MEVEVGALETDCFYVHGCFALALMAYERYA